MITKRVCNCSHHCFFFHLALFHCLYLGCFWHLGCCHLPSVKWISGDKKVKKPRRRPPPVSAAARGALAAACERLYSVGSRCLEAWTGSRVKSSQCNCRAMQPYQTRSDTQLTWLPFHPKCNGIMFKKTNPAGSVEQTYMMPSQCSSTWSFLGGIYLNMLSQHRVGPKKHWDGSNITPHPDSPRHSNVPPSRYSAASLLLSLLLISSLANAAPKSRSSKLKVSIILGWMHNTVHCWYC